MTVKLASLGVGQGTYINLGASYHNGRGWFEAVELEQSYVGSPESGREARKIIGAMRYDIYPHPAYIVGAYRKRYGKRDYAETEVASWFVENGNGGFADD